MEESRYRHGSEKDAKWGLWDLYKPPRDPREGHRHTTRRASRATMDPIERL